MLLKRIIQRTEAAISRWSPDAMDGVYHPNRTGNWMGLTENMTPPGHSQIQQQGNLPAGRVLQRRARLDSVTRLPGCGSSSPLHRLRGASRGELPHHRRVRRRANSDGNHDLESGGQHPVHGGRAGPRWPRRRCDERGHPRWRRRQAGFPIALMGAGGRFGRASLHDADLHGDVPRHIRGDCKKVIIHPSFQSIGHRRYSNGFRRTPQ